MKPVLDRDNIRKICIRSVNWIGDAVMTTPAMGVVRAAFPEASITVAANPIVAELFDPHPYCDRVIVFDKKKEHKGISGILRFGRELREERFDLAVLFQNAFEAAVVAWLARIPRRAGYRTDGRGVLLTHGVPVGQAERRLHHTDYYVHMLNGLGIEGAAGPLRLACTENETAWAVAALGAGTVAAINPGAAYGSAKRWVPERFAAVGDFLAAELGMRVVLTGGPGEIEIGKDIEAAMKHAPINLIGRTTVRRMMAVLSRCRIMITNDSGPMHIAAALDVPTVAVFGPTDHTTTSPLMERCRIVRKETPCAPCLRRKCPTDHRCMTSVEARDVIEAAVSLLK